MAREARLGRDWATLSVLLHDKNSQNARYGNQLMCYFLPKEEKHTGTVTVSCIGRPTLCYRRESTPCFCAFIISVHYLRQGGYVIVVGRFLDTL